MALTTKKAKYEAPDLENYMLESLTNKEKEVSISSPSISKLVIATISRSVGLIVVKGKMKPLIKVVQDPKPNIRVVLTGISCRESIMRS